MKTINAKGRSPFLAELKISYRRRKPPVRRIFYPLIPFTSPLAVEGYLRAIWSQDTLELVEDFVLVCLNSALQPLGWVRIATGGMEHCTVDPRIVFAIALKSAAAAILVAHNHPSGNLEPSPQDQGVTDRLADGARILGLRFVDHVILTRKGAYSMILKKAN